MKTILNLKGSDSIGYSVRYLIVIVILTISSLYPISSTLAYTCGSIDKVSFSNGLDLVDGNVYLTTDFPNSVTIEALISGTPGLILFNISGAVEENNFQIFRPYNSSSFVIVPGDYTLVITVNDNIFNGGGLCEVMTINFTIAEPFEFNFEEDGEDWGVDLGNAKDGGHAFADYDNDGDLDLLVNTSSTSENSRLYRNNGDNTFTDVTSAIAPEIQNTDLERACAWADVNNDGYLDFIRNTSYTGSPYANGAASMEIFIQDPVLGVFGDGLGGTSPIDVGNTPSDHVDIGQHNTEGAGFFDFDGDGDMDVVFDNHNFGIDILRNNYINHVDASVVDPPISNLFSHATPGTGVILGLAQSATDGDYGSFTDVNNDGWVDILMRKRDENDFFLNIGGTFTNGSDIADANNSNKGAVALYDFDNDGDFDAFWTENGANQIFRNDGPGVWTPMGLGGTTGILTNFGSDNIDEVACGDLDNDGDIDILLVGDESSYLCVNQLNDPVFGKNYGSPMTFAQENSVSFNDGVDGESTSMIDIDNDGDLDIYMVVNNNPNLLWINELYTPSTPETNKDYLFVSVLDDRADYMKSGAERPAIGATVVLEDCDGTVLSGLREVNGGTGHGTQDPALVHFGLPDGPGFSYKVRVKYPNFVNAAGDTVRTEVSKWIRPSEETVFPIVMYVRPGDADIICPIEICGDGIDNDFDFLTDCEDSECGPPEILNLITSNTSNCPLLTNGVIAISAMGENLEYSIDNGANYQSDSTFMNLFSGSYNVVVRNAITLCEDFYEANPVEVSDPLDCNSECDIGCGEVYSFSWWGGVSGQQWPITNGALSVSNNYLLTGSSGSINVNVSLDNNDGQNIDFANCGTSENHFYTATCDDPNGGIDCDGDAGTADSQFSYGCNYLTFGITSNNSSEQTSFTFDFQYPTRICQLTIGDIDASGNGSNFESWQDEIDLSADSLGSAVDIAVVHGGASVVQNNNTANPNIIAIYTTGVDTNLDPSDAQGHAVISTARAITSFTIAYSNGPDDEGQSDDHAIWVSSFDLCPQIQSCQMVTTNPHIMYHRPK